MATTATLTSEFVLPKAKQTPLRPNVWLLRSEPNHHYSVPLHEGEDKADDFMKRLTFALLFLAIVDLTAAFAQPRDVESLRSRYYVVVWGYEGDGNAPKDSHTFATFYKGDDLAKGLVRPATISWLPATGAFPVLGANEGRNFSLTETLAMACRDGKRIARWGPYETSFDLYQRALARIRLLNSGRVAYSGLGVLPGTMNCIKAAGDITDAPFNLGFFWGFVASKSIVRHFSPFFKSGERLNTVARLTMSPQCAGF